ncbi:mannitol dehydrogenase [Subtercola boreus]|uniref:Mannitol-1-phosphate 5-dehydrogenase n=1 Tax=Subtercola boreus TaxID=120213 RepID=A0A3E0VQC7_9MICO|nr:mannitol dehydrogenase family protein [Subtercola boreus]RFA12086.1 mannitol dehydrogenase [Subtercola boreus]
MTTLNSATISSLTSIPHPTYDRTKIRTGIVHFGLGNFHRAHQAMYIDRLMNDGLALDWAICGVGVMPSDAAMRDALNSQSGLYSLTLKHPDGTLEPRIIGAIKEYLFAPDDPRAVIAKLADPAVRIVSLTITEGGYNVNQVTGDFDLENPAIAADLKPNTLPRTVFGLITAGLHERHMNGIPPFTVMSCDNIQGNGEVARKSILSYSRAKDEDLAAWIESEVRFPNSMVDRITPVTTDGDRTLIRDTFEIDDLWPVVSEPFTQWVLEDDFALGRPPFEEVGVQLVDDVEPYELMKLRLLNASHQAMAYFGYLSGHRYVHEAAADPLVHELLRRYMDDEATPTLQPVPGINLDVYKRTLLERFANPAVRDTLARLCAESSDRIPKWLLPVVRANLTAGSPVRLSAAIVASWARYDEGIDEQGETISIVDRLANQLTAAAKAQSEQPLAFLQNPDLFGDLAANEQFTDPYLSLLTTLKTKGAQHALADLLS